MLQMPVFSRRPIAMGLLLSGLTACATNDGVNKELIPVEGRGLYVIGNSSSEFLMHLQYGTIKQGVFYEQPLYRPDYQRVGPDNYIVGSARPGDVLAVTRIDLSKDGIHAFGSYVPCGDTKTLVFEMPAEGGIFYINSGRFDYYLNYIDIEYKYQAERAKAYLSAHFPAYAQREKAKTAQQVAAAWRAIEQDIAAKAESVSQDVDDAPLAEPVTLTQAPSSQQASMEAEQGQASTSTTNDFEEQASEPEVSSVTTQEGHSASGEITAEEASLASEASEPEADSNNVANTINPASDIEMVGQQNQAAQVNEQDLALLTQETLVVDDEVFGEPMSFKDVVDAEKMADVEQPSTLETELVNNGDESDLVGEVATESNPDSHSDLAASNEVSPVMETGEAEAVEIDTGSLETTSAELPEVNGQTDNSDEVVTFADQAEPITTDSAVLPEVESDATAAQETSDEALINETVANAAVGEAHVNEETIDEEAISEAAINEDSLSKEAISQEAINQEAMAKETGNEDEMEPEPVAYVMQGGSFMMLPTSVTCPAK